MVYFRLGYTEITIPGWAFFDIGWLAIPLYILVIVATANAVNITDGLDGLGRSSHYCICNLRRACLFREHFSRHFFVDSLFPHFLLFSGLMFLRKIFHGRHGKSRSGSLLGVIAMMIDAVAILPIVGIIFVLEALSVIIQVISKRLRNGKKVFDPHQYTTILKRLVGLSHKSSCALDYWWRIRWNRSYYWACWINDIMFFS